MADDLSHVDPRAELSPELVAELELEDRQEQRRARQDEKPDASPAELARQTIQETRRAQAALARELYRMGACVPHAAIDLEKLEPVLGRAWWRMPADFRERFAELGPREGLAAAFASVCEALYAPCKFSGGCDDARGFDASGCELPRVAAMLMGRDTYSGRHVRRVLSSWELEGTGFRKHVLVDEEVSCECGSATCKGTYSRSYDRNQVYVSARELARWRRERWLRPFVLALRDAMPTWAWLATDAARTWRKCGLTYADTLTTSRDDLAQAREWRERLTRKRSRVAVGSNVRSTASPYGSEKSKSRKAAPTGAPSRGTSRGPVGRVRPAETSATSEETQKSASKGRADDATTATQDGAPEGRASTQAHERDATTAGEGRARLSVQERRAGLPEALRRMLERRGS